MSKNFSEKLSLLHKIVMANYDNFDDLLEVYLSAGEEIFNTEFGVFTSVNEKASSEAPTWISTPVFMNGEICGTMSFFSQSIREQEFSSEDVQLIEMMAQSMGQYLEIQRHKKLSESSAKMALIGEMVGGIAHEINNPMSIISSNSEFVFNYLQHKGELNGDIEESLVTIKKTVSRVRDIITGLKTIMGGGQSTVEALQLRDVVDTTMALVIDKFKKAKVEIINDINPSVIIYANKVQLSQVILNLAQNSYDAILDNENLWISFSTIERNGYVELLVKDSGIGIEKDLVQKIMTPFYTTKEVGKGTGLGLSLSKTILEGFGGDLIYDHQSINTCFKVRLAEARIEGRSAS